MSQVGIYLPLYDYCLGGLWGPTGMYAPLLAGSIARVVAVMCSAPLELMRTRMQVRRPLFSHTSPAHAWYRIMQRHHPCGQTTTVLKQQLAGTQACDIWHSPPGQGMGTLVRISMGCTSSAMVGRSVSAGNLKCRPSCIPHKKIFGRAQLRSRLQACSLTCQRPQAAACMDA